jgi:hypothetical protein
MSAEGELALRVAWDGHAVCDVDVTSTRPDVAAAMLAGRSPQDVASLVPRVFSICAVSQATAARLALAAAGGVTHAAGDVAAGLRDEAIREYAIRTLIDWPRALGEPEDPATLRDLHGGEGVSLEARERIATRIFGQSATSWLSISTMSAFDRWLERGETVTARMLATLRFGDGGFGQSDTALLPAPDAMRAARLAADMDADADYCRRPTWGGAPAETGALARRLTDPLVAELRTRFGNAVLPRFTARLRELAGLIAGTATLRAGASTLDAGHGIGWAENARGLLVHVAHIADARVTRYRILAPTEWNFHPEGTLSRGLRGTRYASEADLRHRAALLVQSLDPCVAWRLELVDA